MAKLSFLLAVLCTVFTVGEFAGILRKQFLQEPVYVKGEADPGEPLFLTPYIKKKDYRTGIFIYKTAPVGLSELSNVISYAHTYGSHILSHIAIQCH